MEERSVGSSNDSFTKKVPQKTASGGAGPLLGRRKGEGARPRARTVSATSRRETLSLAVCGVGPSRGLELCSSSRPTSETWEISRDGHVTQLQSSTSLPSVGFLRSARLYPLGVVDTPRLQPQQFLGIVSNSRSKDEQRRPVSWVGAGTQAERRKKDSEMADFEGNRHSFSGDSKYLQHRSRLISLPRNTALVPTASVSVEPTRKEKQTSVLSGKSRTLAPLVRQKSARAVAGQEIRVEVRSSRGSEYGNGLKSTDDNTVAGSVMLATLPDLPSNAATPDTQSLTAPQQPKVERKQISIVSVGSTGAATAAGKARQQRLSHWRRKGSPDRRGARLSLGWTQGKPLGPLTVHPVYRDTEKTGSRKRSGEFSESKEVKTSLGSGDEAVVSKDCIVVNVQEYLANY